MKFFGYLLKALPFVLLKSFVLATIFLGYLDYTDYSRVNNSDNLSTCKAYCRNNNYIDHELRINHGPLFKKGSLTCYCSNSLETLFSHIKGKDGVR